MEWKEAGADCGFGTGTLVEPRTRTVTRGINMKGSLFAISGAPSSEFS